MLVNRENDKNKLPILNITKNIGGRMKTPKTFLTALFILSFSIYTYAQDKGKDHPAMSRYEGAELVAWQQFDYVPYVLGTGPQEQKDETFRGHNKYFSEYVDLEGRLTRIQYRLPKSEGLFKVYKNYEQALKNAGYQILFTTSDQESSWPFWNEIVYHKEWGINAIKGEGFEDPFGRYGFRYIAAKGMYDGNTIYFALFLNNYNDYIYITQDVVEINPLESGLVSAQKIEDNIKLSGFISIYGIHFDTGKWNIKPESEPALKVIADFLKGHAQSRYYIVGHTDNVGNFADNMTLSEKRAQAVMTALTTEYGVDQKQIQAYGVASLCPITSNRTDAGKAKNRRVDIVEQ
ncbi:MAG: OmpA family protein [Caldithrix sp.]|nr:OmpA family protein [Caldithrix sp.]